VTLHVGPGTFRPVRVERLEDHALDAERFDVPEATARAIAETRRAGGRVIAVGTTVVRALETTGGDAGSGDTKLLILPGHEFRAVDALITNFHLPGSSLLALVMAFAGVEATRRAYAFAIAERFRFFSYGDALWIR
jgi:S-adenosylmethionine:tRNA ribosyltransferase-isomerase